MTEKQTVTTLDTNQVAGGAPPGSGAPSPGLAGPAPGVGLAPEVAPGPAPAPVNPLYPSGTPQPSGSSPAVAAQMEQEAAAKGGDAPGVEGEQVVWEARYSLKNFIGRLVFRTLLTVAWIALAAYTWGGQGHPNLRFLTILLGVVLAFLWVGVAYRIIRARYGHYYQLTNRRLFVSTGLARRRRDQMELLRVKDVFTRQTMTERWLSVGTVVVVGTENELPTFYLAGVDDPMRVMDLVWHCARAEREGKTVQVENL